VMVRVGGGWDTLENYLHSHDSCRITNLGKLEVCMSTLSILTSFRSVTQWDGSE